MRFPLSSEGPLGRAASVAARHPSYRIESENGTAKVAVELELPEDWRPLDDLGTLLRGERGAEYAADGVALGGEELFGGMGCFLRKQRRGTSARDWCTPKKLGGKQIFPCKQIRVYDNDHVTSNSWYAFGGMDEDGIFDVDKEGLTERVLSDLGPCARCPILDLDGTAEILARLPEKIDPNRDEAWRYRGSGPLSSWTVAKNNDPAPEEVLFPDPKEGLFERLAKSVRSGSAGVAAVSGAAPGSRNVPETRYEDVGGMRETVALVREAVELPITHPEIFQRLGIRPHKGILFYGPPGTGKTLLARAVAHESGAHFIAVAGPEILNKYWGQSEARLRGIFAEARAKAPAVVLFDEIDSFASSRDAMSESFEATLVSQLLSLMDGMNDLGRVCVIATTNRPSALDPALRRPGRFDHEIEVGLPDAEARLHILKIHTQDMPVAPDLDLKQLSTLTHDYSGADLEALCREAALVCMRRTINLRDLEKRVSPHKLGSLSITTYDFRTAMKRVGPSVRR
ncbi:MAG: Cell division protein FtsH [uncultured Rubrobacteraceae bacterium]|uniref:Cell division protein FtsH n=1 Tax=uncultured Rubrobacteraceae bacterium TaxID=349277 RepID=A0A6J4QR88_9ACTN|nr:MAG: Cell division protein FtsH [uncultured Rubrobacteraceae bacterium]